MRAKYFKFLLNECKRLNLSPLNPDDLDRFIDSERGKQDFRAFCALQKRPEAKKRLDTIFEDVKGESLEPQEEQPAISKPT
jgi:hypothetical protein